MNTLSPFWNAAAHLSGAVDLSVLGRIDPSAWSEDRLIRAGLTHTDALAGGAPLKTQLDFFTLADPRYPAAMAAIPYAPGVLFLARPGDGFPPCWVLIFSLAVCVRACDGL